MDIELVERDAMLLGGMSFYGDPLSTKGGWDEENEIGRTWQRFMTYVHSHEERTYTSHDSYFYELHIYNEDTPKNGQFQVFVGEKVNTSQLPVKLDSKYIPSSLYLKVTLRGKEIISDWWYELEQEIASNKNIQRNYQYIIQAYDHRFKGMDKINESELDAYIPVERI
ncbi:GyrI-like domain-containing protein [Vallitalea okinawensis]|uniref:GyrI-like domain-containing protein n=1 Tax=Vallitalea okinawensis TaxID=2078660 RepID=UPI000CFDFF1B|nr:GyrI-like domain-containing protein [Vallitalea okinawensis]